MSPSSPLRERRGPPMSWQRVAEDEERVHAFRLDAGRDWRLAAICGRGPATGLFVDPSFVECVDCVATLTDRTAETSTPEVRDEAAPAPRPARPDIQPFLRAARDAGSTVEELDADHVRLRYDATIREQWLAVDRLYDALLGHATVEGDGAFDSAPDNWVAIHFDAGACGLSRRPEPRPAD